MILSRLSVGVKTASFAALFVGMALLAGSAVAAGKPKPWQWTPAQASTAIRAYGSDTYATPDRGLHRDLTSLTCSGIRASTHGRFRNFSCRAIFGGSQSGVIWATTRIAGGLCWTLTAPTSVPSGCLARGARAKGSATLAKVAMYRVVGGTDGAFYCLANGAGFFTCLWQSGSVQHRGTVVFTPSSTRVKVLS